MRSWVLLCGAILAGSSQADVEAEYRRPKVEYRRVNASTASTTSSIESSRNLVPTSKTSSSRSPSSSLSASISSYTLSGSSSSTRLLTSNSSAVISSSSSTTTPSASAGFHDPILIKPTPIKPEVSGNSTTISSSASSTTSKPTFGTSKVKGNGTRVLTTTRKPLFDLDELTRNASRTSTITKKPVLGTGAVPLNGTKTKTKKGPFIFNPVGAGNGIFGNGTASNNTCTGCNLEAKWRTIIGPSWTSIMVTETMLVKTMSYFTGDPLTFETAITMSEMISTTISSVISGNQTVYGGAPSFKITPTPGVTLERPVGPTYVIYQAMSGGPNTKTAGPFVGRESCRPQVTPLAYATPTRTEDWDYFIATITGSNTTHRFSAAPTPLLNYLKKMPQIQDDFEGRDIATCTLSSSSSVPTWTWSKIQMPSSQMSQSSRPATTTRFNPPPIGEGAKPPVLPTDIGARPILPNPNQGKPDKPKKPTRRPGKDKSVPPKPSKTPPPEQGFPDAKSSFALSATKPVSTYLKTSLEYTSTQLTVRGCFRCDGEEAVPTIMLDNGRQQGPEPITITPTPSATISFANPDPPPGQSITIGDQVLKVGPGPGPTLFPPIREGTPDVPSKDVPSPPGNHLPKVPGDSSPIVPLPGQPDSPSQPRPGSDGPVNPGNPSNNLPPPSPGNPSEPNPQSPPNPGNAPSGPPSSPGNPAQPNTPSNPGNGLPPPSPDNPSWPNPQSPPNPGNANPKLPSPENPTQSNTPSNPSTGNPVDRIPWVPGGSNPPNSAPDSQSPPSLGNPISGIPWVPGNSAPPHSGNPTNSNPLPPSDVNDVSQPNDQGPPINMKTPFSPSDPAKPAQPGQQTGFNTQNQPIQAGGTQTGLAPANQPPQLAPQTTLGTRPSQPPNVPGNVVLGSQTLSVGQTTTINGATVIVPTSGGGSELIVDGITHAITPTPPPITEKPTLSIGGQTIPASIVGGTTELVLGRSDTLTPGGIVTVSGTTYSMPTSGAGSILVANGATSTLSPSPPALTFGGAQSKVGASVVGGTTAFVVAPGQTLAPGNAVTVSGTTFSMPSSASGSVLVVNGATSTFSGPTPVISLDAQSKISASIVSGTTAFVVAPGQTVAPGNAVTVSGTTFSMPATASGSVLVINGATSTLSGPTPVISLGGQSKISASIVGGTTAFIVAPGQTLAPGNAVTVSGTTYSMPATASGSILVVNGATSTLSDPSPTLAIGDSQKTVSAEVKDGTTAFSIAPGQTLAPGSAVTVSGTTYSMPATASGSIVVVNGVSSTLSASSPITTTLPNGLPVSASVKGGTTAFVVATGQTLTPGGNVTVSGTIYSMPASASGFEVVVYGQASTISFSPTPAAVTTSGLRNPGGDGAGGNGAGGNKAVSSTLSAGGGGSLNGGIDMWAQSVLISFLGWLVFLL